VHPDAARRMPGTQAGAEAMAARAVFDALAARELEYFEPVARMPGFSKALARTMNCARVRLVRRSWLCKKRSRRCPATSGGTRNTDKTAPSGISAGRA